MTTQFTLDDIARFDKAIALIDANTGQTVSYAQLMALINHCQKQFPRDGKQLLLAQVSNDIDSIVIYLAALLANIPLILINQGNDKAWRNIDEQFKPTLNYRSVAGQGLIEHYPQRINNQAFPKELALLLSTSGTTGSAKLVQLSKENIHANANSIVEYLHITSNDRAITHLPMSYSYGLSVINSHLLVGASIVLNNLSVIDNNFWRCFNDYQVTNLAGVPHSYELLVKINFAALSLPSLRYLTQAGGRLSTDLVRYFATLAQQNGWLFYIMYGQTEATARMAYLPPDKTLQYPDSIGIAIPQGRFSLFDEHNRVINKAEVIGELVYSGANIMLGYAEQLTDLYQPRRSDLLKTGDLAKRDAQGLYYIVGRKSRFLKILGHRINLDELEKALNSAGLRVICGGTDALMIVMTTQKNSVVAIKKHLKNNFSLNHNQFSVVVVDELPLLANGKINYAQLTALSQSEFAKNCLITNENTLPNNVRVVFEQIFERGDFDDNSSFASLGGDSINYVHTTILLEKKLGKLPQGWEKLSITSLANYHSAEKPSIIAQTSMSIRGLLCILVVAWHVLGSDAQSGLKVSNPDIRAIFEILAIIKMPLFAFISGYFYAMQAISVNFNQFVWVKFRQLMIPMLVVGTLFALLKQLTPGVNEVGINWQLLHIVPVKQYWFIETLFFIFLMVGFLDSKKILLNYAYTGVCLIILILFNIFAPSFKLDIFSINGILLLFPHFMFGIICYRFNFLIHKTIFFIVLVLAAFDYWCLHSVGVTSAYSLNFIYLVFIFALSSLLLQSGINNKLLNKISEYSFSIYIFHVFFTAATRIILLKLGIDNLIVLFLISCIVGILGSILIDIIASRYKLSRTLLLGKFH